MARGKQKLKGNAMTDKNDSATSDAIDAPWAKIPLAVADDSRLSRSALRIYIHLDYLAGRRGYWYGSPTTLGYVARVSPATLRSAIRLLVGCGYISVDRFGGYYVLAHTQPTRHV